MRDAGQEFPLAERATDAENLGGMNSQHLHKLLAVM
jgi:hypothetical protein